MFKTFLLIVAGVSLASLWLDPFTYTLHPAGPEPAPNWWRAIVALETIVLCAFVWSAFRASWWHAYQLIALSIVLSLLANATYVRIRGIDRFLVMLRTEEILSFYLVLIGLRVVALFTSGIAATMSSGREGPQEEHPTGEQ